MKTHICFNCDAVIDNSEAHNCIKGITKNINRLHSSVNKLLERTADHLDGLKYALKIIDDTEQHYKSMGTTYEGEGLNPFHDLRSNIRILLGLPFIARKL